MRKTLIRLGSAAIMLAGLAFMGCKSATSPSTTATITPDTVTYDISNPPSPKYWNDLGSRQTLPSLFKFADGSAVTVASDWTKRRAEIDKILEYYEFGTMPPLPDTITYADDTGYAGTANERAANTKITLTKGSASSSFTVGVVLPNSAMPAGGYPAIIYVNAADTSTWEQDTITAAGYALISYNVSDICTEGTYDGAVKTLFGYDWTYDPDAPSHLMCVAWGVSRIMDVMDQGGFGGKINPAKLVVTGMSRWGKCATTIGAFAISKKGDQIAVTNPGSAGSGAADIERFISPAGLVSATTIVGATGKTLYEKVITDNHSDCSDATQCVLPTDTSATIQYNGWTDPNQWGGIQTLAEARSETPSWFSLRFQEFEDLHYGLNLDYDSSQPTRAPHGYLDSIPFDQHFLTALIAPRGLLIHDGYQTFRNNPEGEFLCYLATKEAYNFLGTANYIGIKIYNIPHSQPNYEIEDLIDFSNAYINEVIGTGGTKTSATWSSAALAKFHVNPFPITDSRSKTDYERLNWARPGATSIADQAAASK